jgi:hypothetical protein
MLHGVTPHGLVYITTTLFPGTECRGRTSSTELSYIAISLSSALSPTYVYLRSLLSQVESSSLISSGQKLRTSAIASPPRSADDVPVVGCQEVALRIGNRLRLLGFAKRPCHQQARGPSSCLLLSARRVLYLASFPQTTDCQLLPLPKARQSMRTSVINDRADPWFLLDSSSYRLPLLLLLPMPVCPCKAWKCHAACVGF